MVIALTRTRLSFGVLIVASGLSGETCLARPFTVVDDINFSRFIDPDPDSELASPILFSPDGQYFAVDTERGRIDLDRAESTIRIYQTQDVYPYHQSAKLVTPPVLWSFALSTYKDGPIVTHWRWLADSSGLAFLVKTNMGTDQLFLADLGTKAVEALTPTDQHVTAFDIRDRTHFVYTTPSTSATAPTGLAGSAVGTGRSLYELMFPDDLRLLRIIHDRNEIWAKEGELRFRVEDPETKSPIALYTHGIRTFALSPDGRFVIAQIAVSDVPPEWATRYRPLAPANPFHIQAGKQDLQSYAGFAYTEEYSLINLESGTVTGLVGAPTGESAGWWDATGVRIAWSDDRSRAILPNTFVQTVRNDQGELFERPCVAVVNVLTLAVNCIETFKGRKEDGQAEKGYHRVENLYFVPGENGRLVLEYALADRSTGREIYARSTNGVWGSVRNVGGVAVRTGDRGVSVRQSFRDPPLLVATTNAGVSRVVLDPNPQLKDIDLGEVSILEWSDERGRKMKGAVYKPPDYLPTRRYPLVVQTHGFASNVFEPSGVYTTAFAARELAAAGIVVLQAPDCGFDSSSDEGPCNVRSYESGIKELLRIGVADADRLGIVGFSRTCYYVLETLTSSPMRFRAASVTDGLMVGYFQYMQTLDNANNKLAELYDMLIGERPFGVGLQQWLRRSPEFNMDKVTAPLLVVAPGHAGLLEMWEPYAALRYLHRPVELVLLRDGTHILTNPAERLASQGGTVDWFRFWLQGYEDTDATKAEQYRRWEKLCDMQVEQNPNQVPSCVHSRAH